MLDLYIRNSEAFIIVYSVTSKQSFADIKDMKQQIVRIKGTERVPIVLVGNKIDLDQRQVSTFEGMALAHQWSSGFLEASAKNKSNVNDIFVEVVREMNINQQKRPPSSCLSCTIT